MRSTRKPIRCEPATCDSFSNATIRPDQSSGAYNAGPLRWNSIAECAVSRDRAYVAKSSRLQSQEDAQEKARGRSRKLNVSTRPRHESSKAEAQIAKAINATTELVHMSFSNPKPLARVDPSCSLLYLIQDVPGALRLLLHSVTHEKKTSGVCRVSVLVC